MSFSRKSVFGSLPSTTRGKAILIGGDPKGENILYTCGNSVVIRNINNPAICDLYSEHAHPPTVARYSPSGFYIASGDTTGTVRIWDTTQETHPLKIELRPISGEIRDLAWTSDNQRIIAVGDGREKYGAAVFWDSGASVGEISGSTKAINSVDIKQTRPFRAATASEDFSVCWFEGPPFKYKFTHRDHTRFVNCVRFDKEGNLLASVGSDKKGVFFDGKTGEKKSELPTDKTGHQGGIYSCSWSADGKSLLTSSGDKTCKVWDVEKNACVTTFTFGNDVEDQQVGCIWQKDHLISLSLSGHLNFLDTNNPSKPRNIVLGHNKFITAMAYDKTSSNVVTGSYDSFVTRWDINTAATTTLAGKGHTNQISQLVIAGDSLISASMDDSVRLTSLSKMSYDNSVRIGTDAPVNSVASDATGALVAAVTNKSLYIVRDGKTTKNQPLAYEGKSVAVSGNNVAVGGSDNKIHFFNLSGNDLKEVHVFENHRGPVSALAFSPDGSLLAAGDNNREVSVLDVNSKTQKTNGWVFHTARINSVAWSPDSTRVASASLDQGVYIWSVTNPDKRINLRNIHQGGVNVVTWLDNDRIATAGQDCAWKIWEIK